MRQVVLNRFEDPKLSEVIWVKEGDTIHATLFAVEFGLTAGRSYTILDTNGVDCVLVKMDNGEEEWFSVEYFRKHK